VGGDFFAITGATCGFDGGNHPGAGGVMSTERRTDVYAWQAPPGLPGLPRNRGVAGVDILHKVR
jgi:hypothetical protein